MRTLTFSCWTLLILVHCVFRGKVLGGCSAINALIWDRSAKEEYDSKLTADIQEHNTILIFATVVAALGNSGWDWNGLEPYYQKAET